MFVRLQYTQQPNPGTPPFIMCGSFFLWLAPHFGRLSEKRKPTISKTMNLTYPLPRLVVQLMIHQTNGQSGRGRFYDDLLLLDEGEYTLTVWLVVIVFSDAYQLNINLFESPSINSRNRHFSKAHQTLHLLTNVHPWILPMFY